MVSASLFAAGKLDGHGAAQLGDAEAVHQLYGAILLLAGSHVFAGLKNGQKIILHGKLAENRFFLRQITHAAPGAQVHWQFRNIFVRKNHAAFIRAYETRYHVKGSGFSGAVRSQQAHNFAMAYLQADLVHNGPRFVGFADAFGA